MNTILFLVFVNICGLAGVPSCFADNKGKNEVFLGGSCNPTTWRKDTAIPKLEKLNLSYYNPQIDNWTPDLIEKEAKAKEEARFLLFVIDNLTRNVVSMIEIAQLSATRSDSLVVASLTYRKGQTIASEAISENDYNELTNGLAVVKRLAEHHKVPFFSKIEDAIDNISIRMSSAPHKHILPVSASNQRSILGASYIKDLYVGAQGSDLLWLKESGQRLIGSAGLTYYQPSSKQHISKELSSELNKMKKARVVVVFVSGNERALSEMILAAYLIGLKHPKVVLSVQNIPENAVIDGEKLTETAVKDYNRGRPYLADMAKKAGVPVFGSPDEAIKEAIKLAKKL